MPQWETYPGNTSVDGLIPLTDSAETYTDPVSEHTEECGLYLDNDNEIPDDHRTALIVTVHDMIVEGGTFGVAVIGVSNAQIEGAKFLADATVEQTNGVIPSDVKVVNYGSPGGTLTQINLSSGSVYLNTTLPALEAASGLSNNDVRVVIFDQPTTTIAGTDNDQDGKNDNPYGVPYEDFPALIQWLADETFAAIGVLKARYPNLEIVIITPPTYSGYGGVAYENPAPVSKRPERMAYWSGFGIRELIQRQLNGQAGYTQADEFPLLVWGPYMWTNGTNQNPTEEWDVTPILTPLTTAWADMDPQDGIHPKSDGTGFAAKWSTAMLKYLHVHPGIRMLFNTRT